MAEARERLRKRNSEDQSEEPSAFHFVNARPQSESERKDIRTLIRANATNFHWHHVKKASVRPGTARSIGRRTHTDETSYHSSNPILAAFESDAWRTFQDKRNANNANDANGGQAQNRAAHLGRRRSHPPVGVVEHRPLTGGGPMDLMGIGHVDPFEVYPSDLPKHVVSPLLTQAIQFLPQVFLPEEGELQSSLANIWLQKFISQRGLFHTLLFTQLVRNNVARAVLAKPDGSELVSCHSVAVQEINKRFQHSTTACDDDNIIAVLALAFHGSVRIDDTLSAPSQGPLKALQVLDVYGGALDTVPMHEEGLAKMLVMRGGLANLEMPGLASQISYGDIITASRRLAKPALPFICGNSQVEKALSAVRRESHPLCDLGQGFVVLHSTLKPEHVVHLYPVLCRLSDYTLAVDDYVEGRSEAQSLGSIAEERNFAQHSLMSLLPEEQAAGEQKDPLYVLCWLAAVIYSMLVVFPLPVQAVPFARLAVQVKEQLSNPTVHERWSEAPQLMLWITVMAAVASIGTGERSFYVAVLDRLVSRLQIETWGQLRTLLQDFLWYGSISDVDGADLWKEVKQSSPFRV